MTTPRDLSESNMVFTKYPELPRDVRRMIIHEAIEAARQEFMENGWFWQAGRSFLFPLSSINHEWNMEVEMILFHTILITPDRLSNFAEICGKRHGRLSKIMFIVSEGDAPIGVEREDYVGRTISQLFNIMKDWNHVDRQRHGLIEVQLDICRYWVHPQPDPNIRCNFGDLPAVPVIGALHEIPFEGRLHPSTSLRLYESLSNVRHVNLNLPFEDDLRASTERASGKPTSNITILPLEGKIGIAFEYFANLLFQTPSSPWEPLGRA